MSMAKIVLLPAYEPEPGMLDLIDELKGQGLEIIVVDDGSSAACRSLFLRASRSAIVLHHPANRGKGAALRTGLTYIREHFSAPYAVVTMDADGQHTVPDALRVLALAEGEPGCLALGCRRFTGHVPLRSRFGNRVTRIVFRLAAGMDVSDTQTGLRAFTDRLTERMLAIPGDRYEYEMNVLMTCARDGIAIRELPIETIYENHNAGSHFHPLRDSFRIYREILRFSASSLVSFVVDYGLFCLFLPLLGSEIAANIVARVCSAAVNFTLNKHLVFGSRGHTWQAALRYAALAAGILVCNTALLAFLTEVCGIDSHLSKILTELALFAVSFAVQRMYIFKRKA